MILPWASHGKAASLVKLRSYEEAENILLDLKEKYPHYMVCYDDLAELYGLQKNYSDQGKVMKQAIDKSPEKFHRHKELANVSLLNNDLSLAEEMLRVLHKDGIHSPHVDSSTIYRYAQVLKL
jgi:predicted Zn-dependent protease